MNNWRRGGENLQQKIPRDGGRGLCNSGAGRELIRGAVIFSCFPEYSMI